MLFNPQDIESYLGSLRQCQMRSWWRGGEDIVERALRAQTITVEKSKGDSYEGSDTPLATWLSLLDDPERKARVSQIRVDLDRLGVLEREWLSEVVAGASSSVGREFSALSEPSSLAESASSR